ncbi:MAG TPA: DUF2723 domain-containing protein [Candidatus Cybelea sp.]
MRSLRLLCALAAFAVPAGIYIACAPIEPASWDTAELQGVPYILGITHPTGFPFYVLAGYVWSHALAIGSVAWRMNAMSAVAMAIACAAAYGVALEFGASAPVALLATLWFAFTQNVWSHAIRAEAQDLAVSCCSVAIYAFVRWMHGSADRWFLAAFALCGLGMAAHPNALWILPALVLGAAIVRRRRRFGLAAGAAALVLTGLALYAYLPLRSSYIVRHQLDPTAALSGVNGGIFWNYNNPSTPGGLALELTGSESQTPAYFLASFNPVHVASAARTFVETIAAEYGIPAAVLLFAGLIAVFRRDWRAALVLCVACTAALAFSVVYPNESDVGRYRMLVSWLAVPLFGALTPRVRSCAGIALHAALSLFLLAGAVTAFRGQQYFAHRAAAGGRWVILAVAPQVPPGSTIVTGWLDATSLAYGAYVDGSLAGRTIVSDDRLEVPRYRVWARGRPVFVLVNPHDVNSLAGAVDYATLDPYHELYKVMP